MMDDWSDNELRNLYRKNGVYKVIKTLNNETHVFAVFSDLEKAICYRDLFESVNWNILLKGVTDLTDSANENIINEPIISKPEEKVLPVDNDYPEVEEVIEEQIIEEETHEQIMPEEEVIPEETLTAKNNNTETIEDEIIDDSIMDPFDDKYIYFYRNKGYVIKKRINNKTEYFGEYETLDEAITARDYFNENNWNINERLKFTKKNPDRTKENKYIYQKKDGYFEIKKKINNKVVSFGRYYNLEDAQTARDYFEEHNWNTEDKKKFKDKIVSKRRENPKRYIYEYGNHYAVRKRVNGKMTDFGQYNNITDAKKARDYFEENDWNTEDIKLFEEIQWKGVNNNPKRFIFQTGNTFTIRRNNIHFGSFPDLDEAMAARDFLEEHDFSLEYKDKYAKKNKPESENYFENKKLF